MAATSDSNTRGGKAGTGAALGRRHPKEYATWVAMRQRCLNPRSRGFKYYGGRGITICPRWSGPGGFRHFLADMGPQPFPRASVNRLDNDGPYASGNVAWAGPREQARNMRSNTVLTHRGRRKILVEWAEAVDMKPGTLGARLARGWSVHKALTRPIAARKPFAQWAPRVRPR